MKMHAVLTGDIVNSTRLLPAVEKKLQQQLRRVLSPYLFEFYRGDSFQAYLPAPAAALQTALLCRAAAIQVNTVELGVTADVRISIGIGPVTAKVVAPGAGKGEAFVLSGRAFDALAAGDSRLAINSANPLANEGLQVMADYTNAIFSTLTGKQAAVIFELLAGGTQQAVAAKLKKSKSTIHQHVSAGRWPEIEKLLQHYNNIIKRLL